MSEEKKPASAPRADDGAEPAGAGNWGHAQHAPGTVPSVAEPRAGIGRPAYVPKQGG